MQPFDPDAALLRALSGDATCRDFAMRIDRAGQWHHEGRPIRRPDLVRLFASVLRRAPDGSHWLVTPGEQGPIEVEETAFTIVELERTGDGPEQLLRMRTNLDAWFEVSAEQPLILEEQPGSPRLRLANGLEARLLPSVYYELAELAVPEAADPDLLGLWSGGAFFPLGRIEPE